MADTSNGLIYGLSELKFKDKVIGWIDENGLTPAGTSPSFLEVKAAQVQDGPVDTILTDPGSDAFTFNLIQLKAENLVDTIGGTKGSSDEWTPPANMVATGKVLITATSGHKVLIPNARLSRNGFQNGINLQNVLALGIRLDMMKPSDGETPRFTIYPPGAVVPED